ncbi:MAG: LacI family DNA-binding transcriptional regulator [Thermaerobacter sp.]|nr:LacI family DNA-binding transcriptional regulator [Thermaerobacter sp.]
MGGIDSRKGARPIATISDVAKQAGVSRTTVSRYLNGHLEQSSDNAQKVAQAISALKYRPNLLARSLRSATTHSVAVIVPDLTNPFYPELLSAVETCLAQHGIQVFVGQSRNDPRREPDMLRDYFSRQVDGIIYVAAKSQPDPVLRQIAESIPVLILDEEIVGFEQETIRVDHELGLYQAAKYLLDLGHRQLIYLAGPSHLVTTQLRIQGLQTALNERGGQAAVEIVAGGYSMDAGRMWAEQFVLHPHHPTAVLCANDLVALGVHRAFSKRGIAIPKTVSLLGFDDIFVSAMVSPTLTTVRQPLHHMGRMIADRLLQAGQRRHVPASRMVVPPELIVRESTAPPPW